MTTADQGGRLVLTAVARLTQPGGRMMAHQPAAGLFARLLGRLRATTGRDGPALHRIFDQLEAGHAGGQLTDAEADALIRAIAQRVDGAGTGAPDGEPEAPAWGPLDVEQAAALTVVAALLARHRT